ncbi:MAG: helix-turn-helix domain-containing protein [Desulfobacterales bacterium]|nr:helix-turn-helix domain-containing protein [Desulfobacterales bacterium]
MKLLRIDQVAARLNCSRSWIYSLINDGKLSALKLGVKKGLRIAEESLDSFIKQRISDFV